MYEYSRVARARVLLFIYTSLSSRLNVENAPRARPYVYYYYYYLFFTFISFIYIYIYIYELVSSCNIEYDSSSCNRVYACSCDPRIRRYARVICLSRSPYYFVFVFAFVVPVVVLVLVLVLAILPVVLSSQACRLAYRSNTLS